MEQPGIIRAFLWICLLFSSLSKADEGPKVALIISDSPSDVSETYQQEINLLERSLQNRQLTVHRLDWQNPNVNWDDYQLVLIGNMGSIEGYSDFGKWCDKLATLNIPLQNSSRALNFYLRKSNYLEKLAPYSTFAIPTQIIPQGSNHAYLEETLSSRNWQKAVAKASVSYFGLNNFVIESGNISSQDKEKALEILATSDLVVQEYMPRIAEGEISFLFFGGRFSHAIEKKPAHNEHRIHKVYGGQHSRYFPSEEEISQVRHIIKTVQKLTNTEIEKIRVDVVRHTDGNFRLIEIELADPTQYLHHLEDGGKSTMEKYVDHLVNKYFL